MKGPEDAPNQPNDFYNGELMIIQASASDSIVPWPEECPPGVREEHFNQALGVYNRWGLSWTAEDRLAFIKRLKYN